MQKKINPNSIKVVNMLLDGHYHDGTTIGTKLGLSRNAVWKIIQKLLDYGIAIDSVKGKGYALIEPLILLQLDKIKKLLENDKVELKLFERVTSTNDYLKQEMKTNSGITFCLAEQQTEGKGRLNREWHSPFGKNIYLSCRYPFQKDLSELAGLSLITSLAIVKALQSFGMGDQLYVKWPNDVLYGQNKLAGNLIEVQAETHGICNSVIGIGLNVNMLEAQAISQGWTSMRNILGQYLDRNLIIATLINYLLDYLNTFNEHGFAYFAEDWMQADCLTNQAITISHVTGSVPGIMQGVNEQGHLLLRLANGQMRAFSTGDTSIVKKPLAISFLND